ncbi:MAG: L,D-transpeptidase family protein [Acidimicrobiaceae bacterium]|nr:L,D-transpeptidase family protein [Acidimicrobiaceae bacterium]
MAALFAAVAVVCAGLAVAAAAYMNRSHRSPAVAAGNATVTKTVGGKLLPTNKASGTAPRAKAATPKTQATPKTHRAATKTHRKAKASSAIHRALHPAPLVVTAVTPGSGAGDVATNAPLTVAYSEPLAATPPLPTLNPPVAGRWTASGSVLTFVPAGGWLPYTTETVTVPAGATGLVDGVKTASTTATTTTFTVQHGSELRLEQLLSELKYLPFTFTPAALPPGVSTGIGAEATQADAVSTSPLPGTLNWAYPNIPTSLSALWTPGEYNTIDKGAIMAFESAENMTMDGIAGPQVWAGLLAAVAARHATSQPYDYLITHTTLPQTLQVWRNGQIIYSGLTNTGVKGAETEPGTFPVFERQASGTMSGTQPDGTKYVDKGVPWIAYFNGGDAVHGFVRPGYGWPQSNGCVELPVDQAAQVWQMDPYGTLVTVLPPT